MEFFESGSGATGDDECHHFGLEVGGIHDEATLRSVGDDVDGAEVGFDDGVVHDGVLKTSQVVVEGDDVLLEAQTTGKVDLTFVALHLAAHDREPFVKSSGITHQRPDGVGRRIEERVPADGAHVDDSTDAG